MDKRRRFKQTSTLLARLEAEARRLREQARKVDAGGERERLLRKARQIDMAASIEGWLSSPGLKPAQRDGRRD